MMNTMKKMNMMKKKEYDEKMNLIKIKIVIFGIID